MGRDVCTVSRTWGYTAKSIPQRGMISLGWGNALSIWCRCCVHRISYMGIDPMLLIYNPVGVDRNMCSPTGKHNIRIWQRPIYAIRQQNGKFAF